MAAGTVAEMAVLAGWVGITVVGMGGAVDVVVADAAVVVVELLELLEHAEATMATVLRAMATAAVFTPRVGMRTNEPPASRGDRMNRPKCATPARTARTAGSGGRGRT
jgi:hypothetical protein